MRLKGRKVLVTGGFGFLGANLCLKLLAEGAGVRVIDLFPCPSDNLLAPYTKIIESKQCNMVNENEVGAALENIDTVVHLAFPMALRGNVPERDTILENLAGLLNLTKAAQERDALFVYVSSIAVYGQEQYRPVDENHPLEPVMMYGGIKLASENICRTMARSNKLRLIILRAADIYGPANARLSVPVRFLLQAISGQPITVYGDGSDSRTYTFVEDFSEAVVLALINPAAVGEVFNVGGDKCVSMHELALAAKKVTGSQSPVAYLDAPTSGRRLAIDNSKIKKTLGYKPAYSIEQGLFITAEWLTSNRHRFQLTD